LRYIYIYTDNSWRDDKQQRQLREQEQQQDEEYGDDSSSAAAAEQQRIQAQEMAAYHKRLASLSLPEAQRLTQIDLKHSDSHVTAQVGHPAYLKCAVSNQGDQLVRVFFHRLIYNQKKNKTNKNLHNGLLYNRIHNRFPGLEDEIGTF
jgi:hypothetical protein